MNASLPLHEATNAEIRETFSKLDFVTSSDEMIPLLRQACKAASASDVTVLLEGETGTGKGVLARAIHQLDQKRCGFPFVTVNCCAVTETLAESELFGHHCGAFTGAASDRHGLFYRANRGSALLDDVNDLPVEIQPKLLDVIQRGVVRPMGADQERRLDTMMIVKELWSDQSLRSVVLAEAQQKVQSSKSGRRVGSKQFSRTSRYRNPRDERATHRLVRRSP